VETGHSTGGARIRWVLLAILVTAVRLAPSAGYAPAQPATHSTASWTDEQIERFLREAEVVGTKRAGKGVTNSLRATLRDGTITHDAQIQQVDERKLTGPAARGAELNFRDSWSFNVAAYKLDRLIGLNLVPVSVSRDYRGKPAAYTWWIDDIKMDEGQRQKQKLQPPDSSKWNEAMQLVRVFDQLIYNMDRNAGNLLITNDWAVWAIDHTRAFRLHKTLKSPESVTRCDREVFERLKGLDATRLEAAMGDYLSEWEREAILARRDAIVAILEKSGPAALFTRQQVTTMR
jgi:hypothetical protein